MSDNFKFWVPLESIKKSKDKDGNTIMKVGGIASTSRVDMDGESLDPNGFDVSYLKNTGIVNWNHSKNPEAVIGEPTKVEIRKDGLYVESVLYPDNPLSKSVYELAEVLAKNSKTRRLGYSIEGKATERDEFDKKKVKKASITGIALTVSPKNPDSIVDIIKGNFHEIDNNVDTLNKSINEEIEFIQEEIDLEKSNQSNFQTRPANGGAQNIIDITRPDGTNIVVDGEYCVKITKSTNTENGKPLMKESVDGYTKEDLELTKAEAINMILQHNPVISIEKAFSIFKNIKNSDTMSTKTLRITKDLLEKSLNQLGAPNSDEEKDLEKGDKGKKFKSSDEDEDDEQKDDVEKGDKKKGSISEEDEEMYGDEDEENEDNEEDDEIEETDKKPMKKSNTKPGADAKTAGGSEAKLQKSIENFLSKSFGDFRNSNDSKFKSVGILIKGVLQEIRSVKESNSELNDEILELRGELSKANETIEELANSPVSGRKSISKAIDKTFEKSIDASEGRNAQPENALSLTRNRKQLLNIIDDMTFEKGVDQDMAKALTMFETSGNLEKSIIKRIESERGVTIVA